MHGFFLLAQALARRTLEKDEIKTHASRTLCVLVVKLVLSVFRGAHGATVHGIGWQLLLLVVKRRRL